MRECYKLDFDVIQSIARYAPEIEEIRFEVANEPANRNHIIYFGNLHKLKALALRGIVDLQFIKSVLHTIATANIASEFLELSNFDASSDTP